MSKDWVQDMSVMHSKFAVNEVVRNMDKEKLKAFLQFRIDFLQEELDEMKEAVTADDAVDALIDLCVIAIGTLDAFDCDAYEAWDRVWNANMDKEVGIKTERPNPLGLPDLVKPTGWTSPTHKDLAGMLDKVYD
tara:strand:- start:751 stop:1152 length:402 start_codon:yes stop_codon:yes gene_type:complete